MDKERTKYGPDFLGNVSRQIKYMSDTMLLAGNIAASQNVAEWGLEGLKGFCNGMGLRLISIEKKILEQLKEPQEDLQFADEIQLELMFIACTFDSLYTMAAGGDHEEPFGALFSDLSRQARRIRDIF